MLNIWHQKREEKQMNPNKDYTPFLQDNFIIFNKNGIIEMKKIPDFGSVVFTSQAGNIVQIETTIKER
ncbi:DUF2292 domain-containing protein [Streptococcus pneumoniae]|uniref:DUF2292 domain-containing protein n=1 Tax=Streptococcus pneumoniae TaxID=1313 RepID=UPI00077B7DA9|nr:DUF2292 domain-containing protein [Streptococcus pneumoniae]